MEGVDLKEVKYVHITEPWWNESRMDQVMGRAIRWKSHINMEPKDRKVIIYRYYALCYLDRNSWRKKGESLMNNQQSIDAVEKSLEDYGERERRILREEFLFVAHNLENPKPRSPLEFCSIDRYIQGVSEKKKRLNQMFYKSIKNSAIDCLFNKHGNTYSLEKEFYNDEKGNEFEYYYDPTEHKYYDTQFKEKKKDIFLDQLFYIDKYDEEEKNKYSIKELDKRKVPGTNDIYRENIGCNFSNKTGKIFEKVLQKKGMKNLLNNEQKEIIKEILFNKIVYKTYEEQTEIKRRLKECLLNKKINIEKFNQIMNKTIEKSARTKIINNIISVLVEMEMKLWENTRGTEVTQNEIQNQRRIIEKESEIIKEGLYEQSIEYLKQSEMMLKIDIAADKYRRDLIKNIINRKKSSEQKQHTIESKEEEASLYDITPQDIRSNPENYLIDMDTPQDNIDAVNNLPH
jgi:hypothetical protein